MHPFIWVTATGAALTLLGLALTGFGTHDNNAEPTVTNPTEENATERDTMEIGTERTGSGSCANPAAGSIADSVRCIGGPGA